MHKLQKAESRINANQFLTVDKAATSTTTNYTRLLKHFSCIVMLVKIKCKK